MTINWAALGIVAAVSLVVGVLVVVLVSLALVGLSAREPDPAGEPADEALVIGRGSERPVTRSGHGGGGGLPSRCGRDRLIRAIPSRRLTGKPSRDGRTAPPARLGVGRGVGDGLAGPPLVTRWGGEGWAAWVISTW